MPAPTALLREPERLAEEVEETMQDAPDTTVQDEPIQISNNLATTSIPPPADFTPTDTQMDGADRPAFAPDTSRGPAHRSETRKCLVPPHRMTPLKNEWAKIYPPLVEHLGLQVRMNVRAKAVELRTSRHTRDSGALQKGVDFVSAFCLGFDTGDAIALLRLDDLYIESFEIKDVKTLQGEHRSRAVGRIAGKDGKTRFAIENASKTRIVLADSKIHILGAFKNIHIAREAVVSLILGAPPGKVYGNLRTVAGRMKERF
ncbi:pre-rRNA-processing protein pno1 [Elasticomyces elasticus]|nr:pre-rRNA-processing protein pno1 [Elasticomyces elasticus]